MKFAVTKTVVEEYQRILMWETLRTKKAGKHEDNGDAILYGALGTVLKDLKSGLKKLEIERMNRDYQTTALLRLATIQWRVPEPDYSYCHSDFDERTSAYAGVKNSH